MAQWVTCLLHKHKEVNLDPPNLCKKGLQLPQEKGINTWIPSASLDSGKH